MSEISFLNTIDLSNPRRTNKTESIKAVVFNQVERKQSEKETYKIRPTRIKDGEGEKERKEEISRRC